MFTVTPVGVYGHLSIVFDIPSRSESVMTGVGVGVTGVGVGVTGVGVTGVEGPEVTGVCGGVGIFGFDCLGIFES